MLAALLSHWVVLWLLEHKKYFHSAQWLSLTSLTTSVNPTGGTHQLHNSLCTRLINQLCKVRSIMPKGSLYKHLSSHVSNIKEAAHQEEGTLVTYDIFKVAHISHFAFPLCLSSAMIQLLHSFSLLPHQYLSTDNLSTLHSLTSYSMVV